jgi:four helix bundle protein
METNNTTNTPNNETKKYRTFTDLVVWQRAVELFTLAAEDAEQFPDGRAAYMTAGQVVRSAGAIGACIAGGYGSQSGFRSRLLTAKGHAAQTQDWYHKVGRLKYLPGEVVDQRLDLLNGIIRMLSALLAKLNQPKPAEPESK